jgi:general secretion pathway protein N
MSFLRSYVQVAATRRKMVGWRKLIGLTLLCGGVLAGFSPQVRAATSSTLDVISADRAVDAPDSVDIGRVTPIARPNAGSNRETVRSLPAGNPLWSIPLSVLSATQERPIFSASRRPPQRAVVAPVELVSTPQPEKQAEPDRPALTLIGAVVGDSDAIAVFLDRTNQKIVRLRQGDTHSGWALSAVQGREVTLKKADRSETLVLQRQEGTPGAPAVPGSAEPGLIVPASGAFDKSYSPFSPRSTPKNGESDGL